MKKLNLNEVSWRGNPAAMKEAIDQNFKRIQRAFNDFNDQNFTDIEANTLRANNGFFSGDTPLEEVFYTTIDGQGVTEIEQGRNIEITGTRQVPIVSTTLGTSFTSITANIGGFNLLHSDKITYGKAKRPIEEIFLTKHDGNDITRVQSGKNILTGGTPNDPVISLNDFIQVSGATINVAKANELHAGFIRQDGKLIDDLYEQKLTFDGDDHIVVSRTGNTIHSNLRKNLKINSLTSKLVSGDTVSGNMVFGKELYIGASSYISASELVYKDALEIKTKTINLSNDIWLDRNAKTVTVGTTPETQISAFKRTKFRLVGHSGPSPIYNTFLVQKNGRGYSDMPVLENRNVDFVIKADGNVGVGIYENLRDKLSIMSHNGFDQLRLVNSHTPQGSDDEGSMGAISWDNNYLYVKTEDGWKRSELSSF